MKLLLVIGAALLIRSVVALVVPQRSPAKRSGVVCIGALPPGGLARTRYLCKRLRSQLPNAKIVVGRWGLKATVEQNHEYLHEAGADQIATTLVETLHHLHAWLPAFHQGVAKNTSTAGVIQPASDQKKEVVLILSAAS